MTATPIDFRFISRDLDAGNPSELERVFHDLHSREITNVEELTRWLEDESELLSKFAAETARRYIAMTCNTEDEEARESYLYLEREVSPKVRVWSDQLDEKFLASQSTHELPDRYEVLRRRRAAAKEIFRKENTELQTRESELQTKQQQLMGSLTVMFEGKEHTLQQMAPIYQDQDRERRQKAYLASLETRRATWEPLNGIFDDLVELRQQMGTNAGFDTYTPYRFRELQRFDYGPELCERFHAAVETAVVPAVKRLNEERKRRLSLERLRPFDLEVDLDGRGPFEPFEKEEELIQIVRQVFSDVDSRFAGEFDILRDAQLLDLMSRKGKAPGGYQYSLEDVRLPFIFCNSVGTHQDVQTLLHEGGHAFHSILSRNDPILFYRDAPIEFAETASMSMEMMGLENLESVYGAEESARTKRKHLEGILRILPWIASIDAFQHWVYAHKGHDRDARTAAWLEIMDRFEAGVDYSGFEDARASRWTAQGHLFGHAFYYIEYGIAQIAALQVWQAYRRDPQSAIENYRRGLTLGGSRPLPELFAATGVAFDVSETMLTELVADIEEQIA